MLVTLRNNDKDMTEDKKVKGMMQKVQIEDLSIPVDNSSVALPECKEPWRDPG